MYNDSSTSRLVASIPTYWCQANLRPETNETRSTVWAAF
ncbi:hypothetical protein MJ581_20405 [Escherichia coli]|nr:hypothetical protein MJ581_20405 [Escherichia coli]